MQDARDSWRRRFWTGAGCPGTLCGGDLVRSGVAATKEEMEGDFAAVEGGAAPGGRLLTALGNHDGSWGQAGEKLYAFNFTPEALYSRCCGSALALPGA